jgi:hypothetical protein
VPLLTRVELVVLAADVDIVFVFVNGVVSVDGIILDFERTC